MRRSWIVFFILLFHLAWADLFKSLNTARIAYFNEKDYKRAKKACLEGIQIDSNNVELHAILGGSEMGLGNWQDATAAFRKAFTIDSLKTFEWISKQREGDKYYYQAFYFSAREYYAATQYEEALRDLRYAELLNQEEASIYVLKGAALERLNKSSESHRAYKKALNVEPENPDINFMIGKSFFESKMFDSSIVYFDDAIEYYTPSYIRIARVIFQNLKEIDRILTQRIVNLWIAGEYDELDQLIKKDLGFKQGLDVQKVNIEQFVQVSDYLGRSYYYFGMAYYYLGNDSLALNNLVTSLEYHPDDLDALYFTGEINLKLNKHENAKKYFGKVAELKEDDLYAWFYLGVCYTQLKEFEKAIDVYENRVLKLDPENIDAMNNLAFIYQQIGNNDKALQWLKKASEQKEEN